MDVRPIVIGRLNKFANGTGTITGHIGDVLKLEDGEYELLKQMDGYHTFEEIAAVHGIDRERAEDVFNKYNSYNRMVTTLEEWNRIGWCEHCETYIADPYCCTCGGHTKRLILSPPCDPFICFDEERAFILSVLRDKFDIILPEDTFFLGNNCCRNNRFFWEIAYKGIIILRIYYQDLDKESWEYRLEADKDTIDTSNPMLLNKESIDKLIRANSNRQKGLVSLAEALILESTEFFDTRPLIYFSGGKESLIMLSIYEKMGVAANVLTVATGVDFPDDMEFTKNVRKVMDKSNLFSFYYYEGNEDIILETLREKKLLSAKTPWCRNDFKEKLKGIGTKDIYKGEDFVAAEGSRWYESDYRRRFPKIDFIKRYPHQVWIHPIAEWTSLDIWIYIFEHDIPLNPIYKKGFQRTTCWLCPVVNPFHILCSRKYYPELWERLPECRFEAFDDDTSRDLPY